MELRRGKGRMTKKKKKNPRPSLFFSACHEASDQPRPSAIPRVQRAVSLTPPPSFVRPSQHPVTTPSRQRQSKPLSSSSSCLGIVFVLPDPVRRRKRPKCQQICTIATIGVMRQEERSAALMPRALPFARRPVLLTLAKALLHTIHVYIPSRFENTSSCNVHETRLRDGVRTGLGEITQVCISNTLPRSRGVPGRESGRRAGSISRVRKGNQRQNEKQGGREDRGLLRLLVPASVPCARTRGLVRKFWRLPAAGAHLGSKSRERKQDGPPKQHHRGRTWSTNMPVIARSGVLVESGPGWCGWWCGSRGQANGQQDAHHCCTATCMRSRGRVGEPGGAAGRMSVQDGWGPSRASSPAALSER